MRGIDYRVYDKDDNKIYKVGGFINDLPFIDWSYDNDFEEYSVQDHYIVKNGELMQYTGLKDKNGKEIYEGDIVRYFKDELATIEFKRGCFVIESENYIDYFYEILGEIEVIGNIYENEDLLEK